MSKTIRVIDLLNKIASGEEVPEKIKYRNCIFRETFGTGINPDFVNYDNTYLLEYVSNEADSLNEIVEIIEEQEEIDIQKLDENIKYYNIIGHSENEKMLFNMIQNTANRINKLVQAVKQLDKKMEEKKKWN